MTADPTCPCQRASDIDFRDRRKIRRGDKNGSFIVKDVTLLGVELWSVGEAAAPRFASQLAQA
jgi:hypothetical protein